MPILPARALLGGPPPNPGQQSEDPVSAEPGVGNALHVRGLHAGYGQ